MHSIIRYGTEILFLFGDGRKKLPAMVVLFFFVSLLDVIGLGLVAPFVTIVMNEGELEKGSGVLHNLIPIVFSEYTRAKLVFLIGAGLAVIFFTKAIAAVLVNRAIFKFSGAQGVLLRNRLMRTYQQMRYEEYIERNSAEYILSMGNFVGQFIASGTVILRLVSEGVVAISILCFLAFAHGEILIILVSMLGVVMFGFDKLSKRTILQSGEQANIYEEAALEGINEGMRGFKELRVLGKESLFSERVSVNSTKGMVHTVNAQTIQSIPRYVLELMLVIFVVSLAIMAINSGQASVDFVALIGVFAVASLRLMPSANNLSSGIAQLRFYRHGVSMIYSDLQVGENNEVRETTQLSTVATSFKMLQLKNIGYRYPGTKNVVLNNIDLTINRGEAIGIVGKSGSGKSTLMDVMLGLLEPIDGEILFNGVPINVDYTDWRNQIAYIPQEIFLMDDTAANNIAFVGDHEIIQEDRLASAVQQAQLDELVDSWSLGLSTLIGENGVRLSGGEKQRVALARALYHEKSVLVMDEATSALDKETEEEVIREISTQKGIMTLIIIAHRYSTLQHCDRIYRLDKGKIVGKGTYSEMCERYN